MEQPIRFILNDESIETDLHGGTVVLDFLRRHRRLTGTKESCREGDCGACAVLLGELAVDGQAIVQYRVVNSCLLPLGDIQGKHLVSIEGINPPRGGEDAVDTVALTPVQSQLVVHGAIQCGFCTPGFVVSLTGYLLGQRQWSFEGAVDAVAGNICRCTGYASIKRAIVDLLEQVTGSSRSGSSADAADRGRLETLVACGVVPAYFLTIGERLRTLEAPQRQRRRPADYTVVAGGTDLFVQKAEQLMEESLSFVSGVSELRQVREESDRLYLGAGISMAEVKELPELRKRLPQLADALPLIASAPIRNRATLGGNIVNASPIADFTVMLLALGAVLGLKNEKTVRELSLQRFFRGYKQLDMEPGERLEWIALPLEEGNFSFEKVSRRRYLDIASVNSAAWICHRHGRIEKLRLAAGGVAPIPLYLAQGSACLEGQELGDELLEQALDRVQEEISPISDVRGSERYKRLLLRQLLLAHFIKFFPKRIHAEVWA
ncbi:MAG: FAD binding domain-containing protein [Spirochaetaceae bacterium]|nr:MAG: FAD binding domain-containing protein [Spirochaetaceae bacterium]